MSGLFVFCLLYASLQVAIVWAIFETVSLSLSYSVLRHILWKTPVSFCDPYRYFFHICVYLQASFVLFCFCVIFSFKIYPLPIPVSSSSFIWIWMIKWTKCVVMISNFDDNNFFNSPFCLLLYQKPQLLILTKS